MPNLNKIFLCGHLTRDLEMKYTHSLGVRLPSEELWGPGLKFCT